MGVEQKEKTEMQKDLRNPNWGFWSDFSEP